jgi:hypothetical protein
MPNMLPLMKLSPDEAVFLRQWMYDEIHYQDGMGPAKRLQVQHGVSPADLAILIAAAIPDPADQEAAGLDPPSVASPQWPWSGATLQQRLAEAWSTLQLRAVSKNCQSSAS